MKRTWLHVRVVFEKNIKKKTKQMFGHNLRHHVWLKTSTAYQHKYLILTLKHSTGEAMI